MIETNCSTNDRDKDNPDGSLLAAIVNDVQAMRIKQGKKIPPHEHVYELYPCDTCGYNDPFNLICMKCDKHRRIRGSITGEELQPYIEAMTSRQTMNKLDKDKHPKFYCAHCAVSYNFIHRNRSLYCCNECYGRGEQRRSFGLSPLSPDAIT